MKITKENVLFGCFLFIFLMTALITLGGITKFLQIEPQYLDKLFYTLLIELIGVVISIFKTHFGKGLYVENIKKLKIILDFPGTFDIKSLVKQNAKYQLYESNTEIKPREGECRISLDALSPIIVIDDVELDKTLFIEVEMERTKYQGSMILETRKLELREV